MLPAPFAGEPPPICDSTRRESPSVAGRACRWRYETDRAMESHRVVALRIGVVPLLILRAASGVVLTHFTLQPVISNLRQHPLEMLAPSQ
jgi:hypothetical protein